MAPLCLVHVLTQRKKDGCQVPMGLFTNFDIRQKRIFLQHFRARRMQPGLGTAFFPVQNVPLFPALLKNVPFFPVLFLSFWRLMRPKRTECSFPFFSKERKERSVLLQRTGKNAKIVPFFYKEWERTRERSVLLQKIAEHSVLFSIYIYRYIYFTSKKLY